jgi:hypothetical protein
VSYDYLPTLSIQKLTEKTRISPCLEAPGEVEFQNSEAERTPNVSRTWSFDG